MSARLDLSGVAAEQLADDIEARANADLYAAAPPAMRAGTMRVDGATVLTVPTLPASYFNRVIGLGNSHAVEAARVEEIQAYFASLGIKDFWIHVTPAAARAGLARLLTDRGFAPPARRSWAKFLRPAVDAPAPRTDLATRPALLAEAPKIAEIACSAFGLPPTVAPWFAALVGRPRWQVWVAERAGTLVGTGVVFIDGPHAWLGIGATLTEHRGLGAQSSLLAARIAAAARAGASVVATETGEAIGEEKNQSLANIQRAGFMQVCSRTNYAPPAGDRGDESTDPSAGARSARRQVTS